MKITYDGDVATITRRGRTTMIGVAATASLALADKLGRPTTADVVGLAAALQDARRPRCGTTELPSDHRQVLVELKPKRKNSRRPVFAVGRYFRDEGQTGWADNGGEDINVVRWWPIAHEVAPK
jgi:hypothetical protein